MKDKKLIALIITWVILTLLNYYCFPYFIIPLVWIITVGFLLILIIIQLMKLYKERRRIPKIRFVKLGIVVVLLFLTYYRFYAIPNFVIEKADWYVLKNKREKIIDEVKQGKLNPNVGWNGWVCELPFEFPIVSNGGNDIGISRNKNAEITVKFWVFRNFFDSPSTYLIYTEIPEDIRHFEKKIKQNPDNNWKIENNWYRIYAD